MYEDDVFARFLLERVEEWQEGKPPLFLFWAFHIAHSPYQVRAASGVGPGVAALSLFWAFHLVTHRNQVHGHGRGRARIHVPIRACKLC